jgi:integrase
MLDSTATLLADYVRTTYHLRRPDLSLGTIVERLAAVRRFSDFLGRPASLADLEADLVARFILWFRPRAAPATVNSKRRALLALWRDAISAGVLAKPPGEIRGVRDCPKIPEAWTLDEISRIVQAAGRELGMVAGLPAGPYWRSLILAAIDTGARIGALSSVSTADVNLLGPAAGIVLQAEHAKTKRPEWRPLHPQTVAACEEIWSAGRELMWPWPMLPNARRAAFAKILRNAGVRYGRACGGLFHKLRRTSGSLVEANGGDGSRQLGNTRKVFERHYLDPRISGRGQLDFLPRPEL